MMKGKKQAVVEKGVGGGMETEKADVLGGVCAVGPEASCCAEGAVASEVPSGKSAMRGRRG